MNQEESINASCAKIYSDSAAIVEFFINEGTEIINKANIIKSKLIEFDSEVVKDVSSNITCRSGCSYCCRGMKVICDKYDAVSIYIAVRDRFGISSVKFKNWINLVSYYSKIINEGASYENIDCPVLDQTKGMCMAYNFRPMVCRAYNSVNVDDCIDKFRNKRNGEIRTNVPIYATYLSSSEAMFDKANLQRLDLTLSLNHIANCYPLVNSDSDVSLMEFPEECLLKE